MDSVRAVREKAWLCLVLIYVSLQVFLHQKKKKKNPILHSYWLNCKLQKVFRSALIKLKHFTSDTLLIKNVLEYCKE